MRWLTGEGARVLLAARLPYGTETNQMKFPLAMNLNPSTVARVIADLVDSLARPRNLALPSFERTRRQRPEMGAARASSVDESSPILMQLVQGIIRRLFDHLRARRTTMPARWRRAWGWLIFRTWSPSSRPTRVPCGPAVSRPSTGGGSSCTRPWHLLTTNSGSGDPRAATAAKGEELTALVVERIGRFLCELARVRSTTRFHSEKTALTGVASEISPS